METTDYVSYPIALALKKAGFDWKCDSYYDKACATDDEYWHTKREEAYNWNGLGSECQISAPTLWQAQKWLREKGIDIEIRVWIVGNEREYRPYIMPPKCRDFIAYPPKKLYESALSAGIEAALKLLDN